MDNQNSDTLFCYESSFNLLYIIKNYKFSTQNSALETKEQENSFFSNVFIWDINKQRKKILFSDELATELQVRHLIYELSYRDSLSEIVFNNSNYLFNNTDIPFRHPKNLLLIETYHLTKEKVQLWLSSKQGDNLRMIAEFSLLSTWHLDVKNNCIRIVNQQNYDIDVVEILW